MKDKCDYCEREMPQERLEERRDLGLRCPECVEAHAGMRHCDECGEFLPEVQIHIDEDGNAACKECLKLLEQEEEARDAELDDQLAHEAEEAEAELEGPDNQMLCGWCHASLEPLIVFWDGEQRICEVCYGNYLADMEKQDGLHPSIIDAAVATLAMNFSTIIRRELADKLTMIRIENEVNAAAGRNCCATQDCCDANMFMHEAWVQTFGVEPKDCADEEERILKEVPEARRGLELATVYSALAIEADIWNDAWDVAKYSGFRFGDGLGVLRG